MLLEFKYQEEYSRLELLLRSFFGIFYIIIPHYFLLIFFGIAQSVISIIAWFAILFTGKYPKGFFDFNVKIYRWVLRIDGRMNNFIDGYPAFGLDAEDEKLTFDVEYKEEYSRGKLLLITFFGIFYIIIPHAFCLYFRLIASLFLSLLAWFAILFTGKYPKGWFEFNVGTVRWIYRFTLYTSFMLDKYPPFSGKRDEELSLA